MSRLTRWWRSRKAKPEASVPSTPYEHLLLVPRFEVCTERVLGEDFRIADGASFYSSYREIITNELYRFQATCPAPLVVDCGANCGVSVIYFKQLFPAARIIAVEADPQIFELLRWNILRRKIQDVTLINKAVAAGGEHVAFHREGADAGRIHALREAKEQIVVPVIRLDDLLSEPVELLKIDIEGAETEVLCASERLHNVSQIMVEYHSFGDAAQSLHFLLNKLASSGFRYYLQTQFCPARPLVENTKHLGMDLQLNIFAKRGEFAAALHAGPLTRSESPPSCTRAA